MNTEMSTSTWSRVWRPSQASTAQPPHRHHVAPKVDMRSATRAIGSGAWFVVWRETEVDKRCSLWWGAPTPAEASVGWRDAKRQSGRSAPDVERRLLRLGRSDLGAHQERCCPHWWTSFVRMNVVRSIAHRRAHPAELACILRP